MDQKLEQKTGHNRTGHSDDDLFAPSVNYTEGKRHERQQRYEQPLDHRVEPA
jgi:hypothetical protein